MVRMKHVLYAVGIAAALVGPAAARADAATVTVSVNAQLLTINQSGDPQICPEGAMTCTSSLAGAEVKVQEVEGNPGYYTSNFYLRPHYQLEGLTVSLRLVSRLPKE